MSAREVSDATVEAGLRAWFEHAGLSRFENVAAWIVDRNTPRMRAAIEAALPLLSPRPDAEVEVERLTEQRNNASAEVHRLNPLLNEARAEVEILARENLRIKPLELSLETVRNLYAGEQRRHAEALAALAAVTALTDDRGRVARNLRFLVEGAAGKHCVACDHVRHNDLAYCQVGQCPCSEGVTVASTAAIILRDLRAALTTPAPAPVDDREALAGEQGLGGPRRSPGEPPQPG